MKEKGKKATDKKRPPHFSPPEDEFFALTTLPRESYARIPKFDVWIRLSHLLQIACAASQQDMILSEHVDDQTESEPADKDSYKEQIKSIVKSKYVFNKHWRLSQFYVKQAMRLSKSYCLHLHRSVKRALCKKCRLFWIADKTVKITLIVFEKKDMLHFECLGCGGTRRLSPPASLCINEGIIRMHQPLAEASANPAGSKPAQ